MLIGPILGVAWLRLGETLFCAARKHEQVLCLLFGMMITRHGKTLLAFLGEIYELFYRKQAILKPRA